MSPVTKYHRREHTHNPHDRNAVSERLFDPGHLLEYADHVGQRVVACCKGHFPLGRRRTPGVEYALLPVFVPLAKVVSRVTVTAARKKDDRGHENAAEGVEMCSHDDDVLGEGAISATLYRSHPDIKEA